MKTIKLLTLTATVLFALIILSSCAEVQHIDACRTGQTYGFFGGLCHGIIAPVSFALSLFSDNITVWAVNNNGAWMLAKGMMATVNSDDPAYFGGYINENYQSVAHSLNLTHDQIIQLAKNSFTASFLSEDEKLGLIEKVDRYCLAFNITAYL